jgi:c-di-GMP-binding flagellar brake protein YcgR
VFECQVRDLSESGARLRTEIALRTGQRGILVVAPLDEGVPVVSVVEVVRTELDLVAGSQDAGVRFQSLTPATRARLAGLLVGLGARPG